MKKHCAVIGAGLGGLSAAIALASHGHRVEVFEQNAETGGKAGTLRAGGFTFDTGPSLLTMPFVISETITMGGGDPDLLCPFIELDEHCRYFYPDGLTVTAHRDMDSFAREIGDKTADSADAVRKYLDYSRDIYDYSSPLFLFRDFHERSTFVGNPDAMRTLRGIRKIDPFRTMHRANASFFRDPRVVQLFDRYATYNGSSPYRAPATLNIIPHVECAMGGYSVKGGIRTIPLALTELSRKMGVTIHPMTPVERITVKKGRVTGITAGGLDLGFDAVFSNIDVRLTYEKLLGNPSIRSARRYRRLEPSSSAMIFYWGVRGREPGLGVHNILFTRDYPGEFRALFKTLRLHDDPTIYIYISSKIHGKDAPRGSENWFVMINAPCNCGQDWAEETDRMRHILMASIRKACGIDLTGRIVHETVATPETIESRTGSSRGSIYGVSSNARTSAFLRQRNRSTDYRGLYFCGGSAHPGGGIPLTVLSGRIAADLMEQYG